jgi:hypothetical protein
MGNLGDSLQKHANRLGISRQVKAVGVVEASNVEISKYIKQEEFEVISFKDGVLKVGTESSSAQNYITLNFSDAIKKEYGIKRFRFEKKPTESRPREN